MSNSVDKREQPVHPYQIQGGSHWSALEEQNQLSTLLGHHGNDQGTNQWHSLKGMEVTSDISGSVKKRTKNTAIDFGILKSKKTRRSRKQRMNASSNVKISQESQHTPNVEHVPSLLSLAPPGTESSYMDYHIQHTSVSQCRRELVKSQKFFGCSLEDFNGTSFCASPQISNLEKERCRCARTPTAPSSQCRLEENDNQHVTSIPSSKRKLSDTNIMNVMEHEKRSDGSGVLSDNLSLRNNLPPAFREKQYQKMNSLSSTSLLSNCAREANTMRKYTAAKNLGGFISRCPVNHTFPVMEITDTNLRKEEKSFRDSRVLTQVQENVPINCYSLPQLIGHGNQGVEIQVLSSDSEGEDDVHNGATEGVSKNTSAEVRTMDMNMIKDKHVPGIESSSSEKNVSADTDLPHLDRAIGTLGEKVQPQKRPIPTIPDINIPLHAEPGEASVGNNEEPSASETRSLDLNYVPDSSSKWLERLKISDSGLPSVVSTKSLRLDEATTHKEANQFVSRGIIGESSNSEPVPVSTGKELMIVNQKTTPVRDAVSSSNVNVDGSDGKWLHTWIQRWRKSPAATPQNRTEPVVLCDPQCSKVSLEELENKPFSSIAAMALSRKGWSGPRCHFQDEGPFTVWKS